MNRAITAIAVASMLVGCGHFPTSPLGNPLYSGRAVDVYLIPMEGYPQWHARKLATELNKQHELHIKPTTTMGISDEMYDPERGQYITGRIAKEARAIASRMEHKESDPLYIILTHHDINAESSHLRFVFASSFPRMSVVSTARMDPANYGRPPNPELTMTRLIKMVNRLIGEQHYGYGVTTDTNSVMYGPIMGVADFDRMGIEYNLANQTIEPTGDTRSGFVE